MEKIKVKVENVKVYGLENAVRCSKFPMQTDISELPNNEYISYWLNQEPFLREFDDYQKYYGTIYVLMVKYR